MARRKPIPSQRADLHECRWEPATRADDSRTTGPAASISAGSPRCPSETIEPYWQSYVVFIVRDDRPADILFQCSDNTWQAYNRWPNNYSVYTASQGQPGALGRRQLRPPLRPRGQYDGIVNDPLTVGSGEFLCFEFPLAYWLEQHGYDVTYCSNSDMLTPDRGLKCKAFLSVGHDEYWDIRQYRSVEQMRDAGVNLLFLSGNAVCWVTPLQRQQRRPARTASCSAAARTAATTSTPSDREKEHGPFPERGPDEGLPDGRPQRRAGQRRRRLDLHEARALDLRGHRHEKGDRIPGLIGVG